MSGGPVRRLSDLLANRWQVPLALSAALVAAVALYRLIPNKPPANFETLTADLAILEKAGDVDGAANAIANLLELQPPLPPAQRALLNDRLATLLYQTERNKTQHSQDNLWRMIDCDEEARQLGFAPSPAITLRDAHAKLWLNQVDEALAAYRGLLHEALPLEDRRNVIAAVVRLLAQRPDGKAQRQKLLDELLQDETLAPAYVWWALQRALQDALDDGGPPAAKELLARYGDRLKSSDLKGYLDYLHATVLLQEGRAAEAEPIVRWIDEWLTQENRPARELDDFGHLPSLNRCLAGRIHLAEERPQDALAAFDGALQLQTGPDLRVDANVGRGRALALLERHEAARAAYRGALEGLRLWPEQHKRALAALRQDLQRLYDQRQAEGDFANALAYLAMAGELPAPESQPAVATDTQPALVADEPGTDDPLAWRKVVSAADFVRYDERRLTELLWTAAAAYDRAGRLEDLRRTLERFVAGRSDDPRMPRVLLLLGQACEGCNDLDEAARWYGEIVRRYPWLEEAAQAQVATARVLVSRGPDHYGAAEEVLTSLLNGGTIAPEAPAYRDALLTLCELYYHQGRYADAIGRLWDFCALNPRDPEQFRVRFMLANAHRRSAYALRHPADGVSAAAAEAESRVRFRSAADLYGKLLSDLEELGTADETTELYGRLALLYRGDCLFELNEPDTLREALRTYGLVGARYAGQPAVLVANVQIANTCLRLGDMAEAARALERARWLLPTIPAEAYAEAGLGDRAQWDQYLTTVLNSDLFRDVLAAR
jgi:tetratricopeptide (TPR) repeat protein